MQKLKFKKNAKTSIKAIKKIRCRAKIRYLAQNAIAECFWVSAYLTCRDSSLSGQSILYSLLQTSGAKSSNTPKYV